MVSGHIGADAKIVTFNTGEMVSFSVGVQEPAKNLDGTWGSRTIWYSCQCANLNLVHQLTKGCAVILHGKPYANLGNDGKAYLNIRVTNVEILSRPKQDNEQQAAV